MSDNSPIYIKHLSYTNVGPIASLEIDAPFDDKGNPKPIVFVGENGSGKSTVLSNITDSLLEIGGEAFTNVLAQEGLGHQYFKGIFPQQIKIGSNFQTARIDFTNSQSYLFKSGELSFDEYVKTNTNVNPNLDWGSDVNSKKHTFDKKEAESLLEHQVTCSFLSNRHEKPSWMGELYYRHESKIGPSVKARFSGQGQNPILVDECKDETLQWLLDIIADSRTDIKASPNGLEIAHNPNVQNTILFGNARLGIEQILSSILGKQVYFDLGYRNAGASRFQIKDESDNSTICPSLDSLSTGQIILFELFATIIRYADNNNVNNSLQLDQIKGIVVVDEVDLHLHVLLQKEVLPRLIKTFPRVQFIVSTHSPLLLLGLEQELGADNFLLVDLPSGSMITAESFREFEVAYKMYASTKPYWDEMRSHFQSNTSLPLIVTEGTTDWRILEKIQQKLSLTNPDLFKMEFGYFKHSPKCDSVSEYVCEMGSTRLKDLCTTLASLPTSRHGVIIAITDRDEKGILKTMNADPWVDHGNNVYSFAIPYPLFRQDDPEISIEQMLTDDTMKSAVICSDGIARRLYTSDEFDSEGRCVTDSCPYHARGKVDSKGHVKVIDGDNVKLIDNNPGSETNYALSKIEFAKAIATEQIVLKEEDINSFIPLFKKILQILESAREDPFSTSADPQENFDKSE